MLCAGASSRLFSLPGGIQDVSNTAAVLGTQGAAVPALGCPELFNLQVITAWCSTGACSPVLNRTSQPQPSSVPWAQSSHRGQTPLLCQTGFSSMSPCSRARG